MKVIAQKYRESAASCRSCRREKHEWLAVQKGEFLRLTSCCWVIYAILFEVFYYYYFMRPLESHRYVNPALKLPSMIVQKMVFSS